MIGCIRAVGSKGLQGRLVDVIDDSKMTFGPGDPEKLIIVQILCCFKPRHFEIFLVAFNLEAISNRFLVNFLKIVKCSL